MSQGPNTIHPCRDAAGDRQALQGIHAGCRVHRDERENNLLSPLGEK